MLRYAQPPAARQTRSATRPPGQPVAGDELGIDQVLFGARSNLLPDFRMRGVGGTTTPQEAGTSTVPAGLVQTTYRGAVGVLSAGQIPWYSGWTRGWASATTP